ncbi:MAG: Sec-independent protein translocase protein TatB [Rhodospirillaceae bacterium]
MSWWELSIVGLMMILVLGPKELPHAMRTMARMMRKARRLASEFQGHMDDLVREADLDDVRKTVNSIKNHDIGAAISQAVDPKGELQSDLKSTLDDAKQQVSHIKTEAGPTPASLPGPSKVTPATTTPATTTPAPAAIEPPAAKTEVTANTAPANTAPANTAKVSESSASAGNA